MSKNYKQFSPVKQYFDMSCWAASLEWWSRYMSPQKTLKVQSSLIYEARDLGYSPNVAPLEPDYAALQIEHTETMLRRPDFAGMNAARVSSFDLTPTYLKEKLAKGPMFISYYDASVGGGHANIIINCKTKSTGISSVRVMEPRTGTFERRTIDFYYNDGETIIGWL
jgi:hypothetical protein